MNIYFSHAVEDIRTLSITPWKAKIEDNKLHELHVSVRGNGKCKCENL